MLAIRRLRIRCLALPATLQDEGSEVVAQLHRLPVPLPLGDEAIGGDHLQRVGLLVEHTTSPTTCSTQYEQQYTTGGVHERR